MNYVTTYGKSYETKAEYKMRSGQYASADAAIAEFNSAANAGHGRSSWVVHNKFSSYTPQEWANMRGYTSTLSSSTTSSLSSTLSSTPVASEVDWVASGHVTPVQD